MGRSLSLTHKQKPEVVWRLSSVLNPRSFYLTAAYYYGLLVQDGCRSSSHDIFISGNSKKVEGKKGRPSPWGESKFITVFHIAARDARE